MAIRTAVRREEGAVAITTAILLVVLLLFAGLIVDLGLLRVDRSDNQLVADSAAVAGVLAMRSETSSPYDACVAAWAYAVRNLPDVPDNAPDPCAAEMGVGYSCDVTDVKTPSDTIGSVTITIVYPVLPSGGPMDGLMNAQPSDPTFDGVDPCERMGVLIETARDFRLAPVSGFAGGSTTVGAVGRTNAQAQVELVSSLVVLDPTGCDTAVVSSNNGRILVGEDQFGDPGLITIDSDGSECLTDPSRDYVIRMNGDGSRLCAGLTNLDAAFGGAECASEPNTLFSPSMGMTPARDVSAGDDPQVSPAITRGGPATRKVIDHRYNCKAGGYDSGVNAQQYSPVIEPCDTSTSSRPTADRAHVDQVSAHFAPSTGPSQLVGGVSAWRNGPCGIANNATVDELDESTNVYFNCDLVVPNGATLRLDAKEYIVVNGHIDISGTLEINLDSKIDEDIDCSTGARTAAGAGDDEDLLLVVNGEDAEERSLHARNGSAMKFHRTAGYFRTGRLEARECFQWIAPDPDTDAYDDDDDPQSCTLTTYSPTGVKVPAAKCFEDLVIWTNDEGQHLLTSGGALDIEGIFFTPHAGRVMDSNTNGGAFTMAGGASQKLDAAQFFAHTFDLTGSAKISMTPDPTRNEPDPIYFTGLIR